MSSQSHESHTPDEAPDHALALPAEEKTVLAPEFVIADEVTLTIPKDGQADILPGKYGMSADKSLIFSDSFGPCQAVVAHLESGEFIIYHATVAFANTSGVQALIKELKQKERQENDVLTALYVLQKRSNASNITKAPALAVGLTAALGVKALRIEVDHYTAVICDPQQQRVTIARELIRQASEEDVVGMTAPHPQAVDLSHAITYQQSVKELRKQKQLGLFPDILLPHEPADAKEQALMSLLAQIDKLDRDAKPSPQNPHQLNEMLAKSAELLQEALQLKLPIDIAAIADCLQRQLENAVMANNPARAILILNLFAQYVPLDANAFIECYPPKLRGELILSILNSNAAEPLTKKVIWRVASAYANSEHSQGAIAVRAALDKFRLQPTAQASAGDARSWSSGRAGHHTDFFRLVTPAAPTLIPSTLHEAVVAGAAPHSMPRHDFG